MNDILRNRYRVYVKHNALGISIYANKFTVDEDGTIEFMTETGMTIAFFDKDNTSKIMTGPTADDVAWNNDEQ